MFFRKERHGLHANLGYLPEKLAARFTRCDVLVQFAHLCAAELARNGERAHIFKTAVFTRPDPARKFQEFAIASH
jgi:hypothetical protein